MEVDYRLRECLPDTIESVVSMVIPKGGSRLLAAFIVVKSGRQEMMDTVARMPDDIKRFQELMDGVEKRLQSLLPSYMVPSLYVPIYKIPLSASRKIDRRRLQFIVSGMTTVELSSLRGSRTSTFKPPSTRMEKRIQSLWVAILNIGQIGIDDHFFRLGGDSLTAMRLVSTAGKEGIAMTVDQVFRHPILSHMALTSFDKMLTKTVEIPPFSLIRALDLDRLCDEAVLKCNIQREQIEDIYPCTLLQGIWIGISSQKPALAGSTTEQGQVVFSLPKSLDMERLRAALRSLVSRHPILRSRIIRSVQGLVQVVVDEPAELCTAESLDEYLKKDRETIIQCGQRLQRYCFIQVKDTNERYFVWSASHSSYDGWGLKLFFEELEATYLRGPPQDPPIKMNAFIKYLGELDRIAASDFFRSHLAGAVTKPLVIVPDGYGPYNCTLTKRTIQLPNHQGSDITRSMIYQAAWTIVIGRTLGVPDVVFDTVLAGRNLPVLGIANLVGPTATTMYVRVNMETDQTVKGLLQSIRERQITAMPFEHLGQGLMEMAPEMEPFVRDAIRLNIIPFTDTERLGSDIGLKVERSFVSFEVPFYIVCETGEDRLNLGVMSDKNIISEPRVDSLMRQFEHVLLQIMAARSDPEKKIADIDSSEIPDPDWSCTRSPWDWMVESNNSS